MQSETLIPEAPTEGPATAHVGPRHVSGFVSGTSRTAVGTADDSVLDPVLGDAVERLKDWLCAADSMACKRQGQVPNTLAIKIQKGFDLFCMLMHERIGDASPLPQRQKEQMGLRIRRELLPYLLLTDNAECLYAKPRGYAGDFLSIEHIYRDEAHGKGRIGALIDRCFLNQPAAIAVRNRRALLRDEILRTVADRGEVATIMSLACGPATEVFDAFEQLPDPAVLRSTLVDGDFQALAFVSDKRDARILQRQIAILPANLAEVVAGTHVLDVPPHDLVYSIGLVDYFEDDFVVALLNRIHGCLGTGGRVVIGNFHPSNPSKALMDYVLDWKLIHRTEDDMNRLFRRSSFGRTCTRIRFEPAGVTMFAECIK
jgi:extracellular factor (EF) 3-hydroxypalmitic acid methyl ester biosynthesis protein